MSIREKLNEAAAEKILILDGAMGSMIQAFRSPNNKPLGEEDFRGERFAHHDKQLRGCNDILCLTRPDIISGIHEAYLDAGADIIETCSLNATAVSLADFGLGTLAREISAASASLARKAADTFSSPGKPRFVAGSVGPTAKSATFTPDMDKPENRQITWDELEAAYSENVRGLLEGGADLILIETVFDSLNAKAALSAINRLAKDLCRDIPVIVSATVSETGRLLTGQIPEAFCASMLHAKPWAIGLNCSFGADRLKAPLEKLSAFAPCPVIFYPNAGLPDAHGRYSDTPEIMAAAAEACMKEGLVNIIGGCCGSTPGHIAAIAKKAGNYKPRIIPGPKPHTVLAGTGILEIDNDGDLSAIAGLPAAGVAWQKAIDQGNYEEAVEIARDEAEKGCKILYICPDKAQEPIKTTKNFIFLAAAYSDLAKLPVLIESSSWEVIEKGLKCVQGRALIRYTGPSNAEQAEQELINAYGAVPLTIHRVSSTKP